MKMRNRCRCSVHTVSLMMVWKESRSHFQFKRGVLLPQVCASHKTEREKNSKPLILQEKYCKARAKKWGMKDVRKTGESWSQKVGLSKAAMGCSCVPTTTGWNPGWRTDHERQERRDASLLNQAVCPFSVFFIQNAAVSPSLTATPLLPLFLWILTNTSPCPTNSGSQRP